MNRDEPFFFCSRVVAFALFADLANGKRIFRLLLQQAADRSGACHERP